MAKLPPPQTEHAKHNLKMMQDIKVDDKDLDAAQLLPQLELGPDNKVLSCILDGIFNVLARALLVVFGICSFVRLYYRQASYALQRYFFFADRTPQSIRHEIAGFSKIPRHVAFVLDGPMALNVAALINAILEGSAWCLGVGSQEITFYERTGILKELDQQALAQAVSSSLARYFKDQSKLPDIIVRCGCKEVKYSKHALTEESPQSSFAAAQDMDPCLEVNATAVNGAPVDGHRSTLKITLASEEDGRPMLVTLAREYSASIAEGKLRQQDITVSKIHEELQERVGNEPDLLVTFGSRLDLAGFSPWLVRVTELFCLPDNNGRFHYMVFYRALQKFANVKVNLGA